MAVAIDSPLFNKVHQRIHNSKLPRQLSEDEQAEIAYAWDKLSSGQQEVAARHVKIALRAMGFQVSKADVQELLQQHGLQPEAGIPWQAFQEVLTSKLIERSPQDEIRRAFQLFDLQQAGRITAKELALIARQLQCDIEPQELHDMIAEFDRDGDGAINEEEFEAIITTMED